MTAFKIRKKKEKQRQAIKQVEAALARGETLDIHINPKMETLYSTIDVCNAVDVKRERLREWMIRGFVTPAMDSSGKGTIAVFTLANILDVALFKHLVSVGLTREGAAYAVTGRGMNDWMLAQMPEWTSTYRLSDGVTLVSVNLHNILKSVTL